MAMSDCPKCWETPCCCGYEYRNWSPGRRRELAAVLLDMTTEELEELLEHKSFNDSL